MDVFEKIIMFISKINIIKKTTLSTSKKDVIYI